MANTPAQLERQRRYRESHREKIRAAGREYAQKRREDPAYRAAEVEAERERRLADPEKAKEIRQRSYIRNAEKRRADARAYRAAHPEKVAEYNARWLRENYDLALSYNSLRRARIRNAPETEFIDRLLVYERDGGRCHICGRRCPKTRFDVDHLVPLSKGGSHTYSNVATSHVRCNRQRQDGRIPAQLRLVG